jgi:hypothetical protein
LLGKTLVVRVSGADTTYENEWQNFNPAGVSPFVPDDITQFANSKRLCHRARRWERVWKVVEAVGNRCVLHNVAFVQNVGPCRGNSNVERIGVSRQDRGP